MCMQSILVVCVHMFLDAMGGSVHAISVLTLLYLDYAIGILNAWLKQSY